MKTLINILLVCSMLIWVTAISLLLFVFLKNEPDPINNGAAHNAPPVIDEPATNDPNIPTVQTNRFQVSKVQNNEEFGITWEPESMIFADFYKESVGPMSLIETDNIQVLVPEGYEELGYAHAEDLANCQKLFNNYFDSTPSPSIIKLKHFQSRDGLSQGFALFGFIFYKSGDLPMALDDVQNNHPDGFLFNRGAEYCANSHEFAHAYFNGAPMPPWANEGLAQYMQYKFQGTLTSDMYQCADNGYYAHGVLTPFSDLSSTDSIDYTTAMCFWHEVEQKFGSEGMRDIAQNMLIIARDFNERRGLGGSNQEVFIEHILKPLLQSETASILKKYGIEEEIE